MLGDFTQTRLTLHGKPYRLRSANGELYITESSLTGTPGRAPRRLHPRQPPHSALPDHHRSRPHRRPAAELGRPAPGVVRQRRHHPSRRSGRQPGPAVEQELRRLPRQPAGQPTTTRRPGPTPRPGWTSAPRASAVMGRAARTSRGTTPRRRQPTGAPPSSGRLASTRQRAAWSARSATRSATPWRPGSAPARLLRLLRRPSSNTRRGRNRTRSTGPTDGRAGSRTTLSACGRAAASSRAAPRARRATTRTRAGRRSSPGAGGRQQRILHLVPRGDRIGADRAHAAPAGERRQLVRRMPHAANRRQHQGEDSRSFDQPAGAREHRLVRHSQRLHRVPHDDALALGRGVLAKWWPERTRGRGG